MVIFVEGSPSPTSWQSQLRALWPGIVVGLGLGFALHRTALPPPTRVLLTMLPTFFLFAFRSPLFLSKFSGARRVIFVAAYAVMVSSALYLVMRFA